MSAEVAHAPLPDRINLLNLPDEVLEIILSKSGLHFNDVMRVSKSCRRLRDISFSPRIWEYLTKLRFVAYQCIVTL